MKKTIIVILSAILAFSVNAVAADFAVAGEEAQAPKKAKAEIKEVSFHVHLHCANCVKKVEENIAFEKGVKGLDVCQGHQTVTVKYDPAKTSEETLKAAIEKLGYEVSGVVAPEEVHHHDH